MVPHLHSEQNIHKNNPEIKLVEIIYSKNEQQTVGYQDRHRYLTFFTNIFLEMNKPNS